MHPNDNQYPYQPSMPADPNPDQSNSGDQDSQASAEPDFSLAEPTQNPQPQTNYTPEINSHERTYPVINPGPTVRPEVEPTNIEATDAYTPTQSNTNDNFAFPASPQATPTPDNYDYRATPLSDRELNSTWKAPETSSPEPSQDFSSAPTNDPATPAAKAAPTPQDDTVLQKQGFGTYTFPQSRPADTGHFAPEETAPANSETFAHAEPTPAPTPQPSSPLSPEAAPTAPAQSTPEPTPPQPTPTSEPVASANSLGTFVTQPTTASQATTETPENVQQLGDRVASENLALKFKNYLKTTFKKHEEAGFKQHLKPFLSIALISGLIYMFFNSQIILGQIQYLTSSGVGDPLPAASEITSPETAVTADPRIIIPKINVNTPVVYDYDHPPGDPFNEDAVQKALESGVVHYGTTARPGQNGNSVIVGHSSNNWWASGDYKFAFVLLDRLEEGDTFTMHYESKRYVYEVFNIKVVEPTEVSVLRQTGEPIVTLITCTPPGTSWKRLVVQARQISPDPALNEAATTEELPEQQTLPSDGSSALNQVRSWFSRD